MTTYTKKIVSYWPPNTCKYYEFPINFVAAHKAKADENVQAGKADQRLTIVTGDTFDTATRLWADAASAEEFATFLRALFIQYSVPVTNVEVLDNV